MNIQRAHFTAISVLSPGPVCSVVLARMGGDGGREVVVKRALRAEAMELVAREAAVLRALERAGASAPRVVSFEDGALAIEPIAMESLDDPGVLARMRRDAAWRARVASAAFEALADVHGATDEGGPLEIVHGDVTPANVLALSSGDAPRAMLIDFGLARWREGAPPSDGAFRGSLLYAAPEVARGDAFDARADSFSLAATLLHAASGVPPRGAASSAAMLAEAAERPVLAYAQTAIDLFPPAIARILLACLAFDPRERPPATPRLVLQPGA